MAIVEKVKSPRDVIAALSTEFYDFCHDIHIPGRKNAIRACPQSLKELTRARDNRGKEISHF